MSKKYYWLKLQDNFFEKEEVKIIENMSNGNDYIIFYMKLLLKSVKTEGKLRFRDVIPYTPEMLSSITNTNVDTVKVATDLFTKLGLMEIWDDGTLFIIETQMMLGSETEWAQKKRSQRQNQLELPTHKDNVPKVSGHSPTEIEIEIEKELDIDIDIDTTDKKPVAPLEKIKELYNSICKSLPNVRTLSEKRKEHARARWKQYSFKIEVFEELFTKAESSEFLKGSNDRSWKADFEWLLNENNMAKVLEGKYDKTNVAKTPVKQEYKAKKTGFHLANSRGDKYSADQLEEMILARSKATIESRRGEE